jgi:MFS family permease
MAEAETEEVTRNSSMPVLYSFFVSRDNFHPKLRCSCYRAEPAELRGPQRTFCRAAVSPGRVPHHQGASGIPPALFCCATWLCSFVGPLADRYSRKLILYWCIFLSGLTLLTAVTHTYRELLVRHTRGDWRSHVRYHCSDLRRRSFSEDKRGRILGVFYLAIPVGSAAGICSVATSRPYMAGVFRFISRPRWIS